MSQYTDLNPFGVNDVAREEQAELKAEIDKVQEKALFAQLSIQDKAAYMQKHKVQKEMDMDGFKTGTILQALDADTFLLRDENGNVFTSRLNASIPFDAFDDPENIEKSMYKKAHQYQAAGQIYSLPKDYIRDHPYLLRNLKGYQLEEMARSILDSNYSYRDFDRTKEYTDEDLDNIKKSLVGAKVYYKNKGIDKYNRTLTDIVSQENGKSVGFEAAVNPYMNSSFSYFGAIDSPLNRAREEVYENAIQTVGDSLSINILTPENMAALKALFANDNLSNAEASNRFTDFFKMCASAGYQSWGRVADRYLPDWLVDKKKWEEVASADHGQLIADAWAGLSAKTRQTYQNEINQAFKDLDDGNIARGLFGLVTNFDRFLADSSVQMLVPLVAGTLLTAAGTAAGVPLTVMAAAGALVGGSIGATDQALMDAKEFELNNGREATGDEVFDMWLRQVPTFVYEYFLGARGAGRAFGLFRGAESTAARASRLVDTMFARRVGTPIWKGAAEGFIGEFAEEWTQNAISEYNAQDQNNPKEFWNDYFLDINKRYKEGLIGGIMGGGLGTIGGSIGKMRTLYKNMYNNSFNPASGVANPNSLNVDGIEIAVDEKGEEISGKTLTEEEQKSERELAKQIFTILLDTKLTPNERKAKLEEITKEKIDENDPVYKALKDTVAKADTLDKALIQEAKNLLNQKTDLETRANNNEDVAKELGEVNKKIDEFTKKTPNEKLAYDAAVAEQELSTKFSPKSLIKSKFVYEAYALAGANTRFEIAAENFKKDVLDILNNSPDKSISEDQFKSLSKKYFNYEMSNYEDIKKFINLFNGLLKGNDPNIFGSDDFFTNSPLEQTLQSLEKVFNIDHSVDKNSKSVRTYLVSEGIANPDEVQNEILYGNREGTRVSEKSISKGEAIGIYPYMERINILVAQRSMILDTPINELPGKDTVLFRIDNEIKTYEGYLNRLIDSQRLKKKNLEDGITRIKANEKEVDELHKENKQIIERLKALEGGILKASEEEKAEHKEAYEKDKKEQDELIKKKDANTKRIAELEAFKYKVKTLKKLKKGKDGEEEYWTIKADAYGKRHSQDYVENEQIRSSQDIINKIDEVLAFSAKEKAKLASMGLTEKTADSRFNNGGEKGAFFDQMHFSAVLFAQQSAEQTLESAAYSNNATVREAIFNSFINDVKEAINLCRQEINNQKKIASNHKKNKSVLTSCEWYIKKYEEIQNQLQKLLDDHKTIDTLPKSPLTEESTTEGSKEHTLSEEDKRLLSEIDKGLTAIYNKYNLDNEENTKDELKIFTLKELERHEDILNGEADQIISIYYLAHSKKLPLSKEIEEKAAKILKYNNTVKSYFNSAKKNSKDAPVTTNEARHTRLQEALNKFFTKDENGRYKLVDENTLYNDKEFMSSVNLVSHLMAILAKKGTIDGLTDEQIKDIKEVYRVFTLAVAKVYDDRLGKYYSNYVNLTVKDEGYKRNVITYSNRAAEILEGYLTLLDKTSSEYKYIQGKITSIKERIIAVNNNTRYNTSNNTNTSNIDINSFITINNDTSELSDLGKTLESNIEYITKNPTSIVEYGTKDSNTLVEITLDKSDNKIHIRSHSKFTFSATELVVDDINPKDITLAFISKNIGNWLKNDKSFSVPPNAKIIAYSTNPLHYYRNYIDLYNKVKKQIELFNSDEEKAKRIAAAEEARKKTEQAKKAAEKAAKKAAQERLNNYRLFNALDENVYVRRGMLTEKGEELYNTIKEEISRQTKYVYYHNTDTNEFIVFRLSQKDGIYKVEQYKNNTFIQSAEFKKPKKWSKTQNTINRLINDFLSNEEGFTHFNEYSVNQEYAKFLPIYKEVENGKIKHFEKNQEWVDNTYDPIISTINQNAKPLTSYSSEISLNPRIVDENLYKHPLAYKGVAYRSLGAALLAHYDGSEEVNKAIYEEFHSKNGRHYRYKWNTVQFTKQEYIERFNEELIKAANDENHIFNKLIDAYFNQLKIFGSKNTKNILDTLATNPNAFELKHSVNNTMQASLAEQLVTKRFRELATDSNKQYTSSEDRYGKLFGYRYHKNTASNIDKMFLSFKKTETLFATYGFKEFIKISDKDSKKVKDEKKAKNARIAYDNINIAIGVYRNLLFAIENSLHSDRVLKGIRISSKDKSQSIKILSDEEIETFKNGIISQINNFLMGYNEYSTRSQYRNSNQNELISIKTSIARALELHKSQYDELYTTEFKEIEKAKKNGVANDITYSSILDTITEVEEDVTTEEDIDTETEEDEDVKITDAYKNSNVESSDEFTFSDLSEDIITALGIESVFDKLNEGKKEDDPSRFTGFSNTSVHDYFVVNREIKAAIRKKEKEVAKLERAVERRAKLENFYINNISRADENPDSTYQKLLKLYEDEIDNIDDANIYSMIKEYYTTGTSYSLLTFLGLEEKASSMTTEEINQKIDKYILDFYKNVLKSNNIDYDTLTDEEIDTKAQDILQTLNERLKNEVYFKFEHYIVNNPEVKGIFSKRKILKRIRAKGMHSADVFVEFFEQLKKLATDTHKDTTTTLHEKLQTARETLKQTITEQEAKIKQHENYTEDTGIILDLVNKHFKSTTFIFMNSVLSCLGFVKDEKGFYKIEKETSDDGTEVETKKYITRGEINKYTKLAQNVLAAKNLYLPTASEDIKALDADTKNKLEKAKDNYITFVAETMKNNMIISYGTFENENKATTRLSLKNYAELQNNPLFSTIEDFIVKNFMETAVSLTSSNSSIPSRTALLNSLFVQKELNNNLGYWFLNPANSIVYSINTNPEYTLPIMNRKEFNLWGTEIGKDDKFLINTENPLSINKHVVVAIYNSIFNALNNPKACNLYDKIDVNGALAVFNIDSKTGDPSDKAEAAYITQKYGVFASTIINTLGKDIYESLGISIPSVMNEYGLKEKIQAGLGGIAYAVMVQNGYITESNVREDGFGLSADPKEIEQVKHDFKIVESLLENNTTAESEEEEANIELDPKENTKASSQASKKAPPRVYHFVKFTKTNEGRANTDLDVLFRGQDKLEGLVNIGKHFHENKPFITFTNEPVYIPVDKIAIHTKDNYISEEAAEVIDELQKVSYHIKLDLAFKTILGNSIEAEEYVKSIDWLNITEEQLNELETNTDNEGIAIVRSFLSNMGYMTKAELEKVSAMTRSSQEGVNQSILNDFSGFIEIYKLAKERKLKDGSNINIYFKWAQTANGRIMISSSTFNPQNSSKYRFFSYTKDSKANYRTNLSKAMEYINNQGEDFDYNTLASMQAINDLNVDDDTKNELKLLYAEAFGIAQAFDGLKKEETFGSIINTLFGPNAKNTLSKINFDELLKSLATDSEAKFIEKCEKSGLKFAKGIENYSQVATALEHIKNRAEAKGEAFESYLSVELDGTTSGYSFKFLSLPLKEFFIDNKGQYNTPDSIVAKVGVMVNDNGEVKVTEPNVFTRKGRKGFTDIYETFAAQMSDYEAEAYFSSDPDKKISLYNLISIVTDKDKSRKDIQDAIVDYLTYGMTEKYRSNLYKVFNHAPKVRDKVTGNRANNTFSILNDEKFEWIKENVIAPAMEPIIDSEYFEIKFNGEDIYDRSPEMKQHIINIGAKFLQDLAQEENKDLREYILSNFMQERFYTTNYNRSDGSSAIRNIGKSNFFEFSLNKQYKKYSEDKEIYYKAVITALTGIKAIILNKIVAKNTMEHGVFLVQRNTELFASLFESLIDAIPKADITRDKTTGKITDIKVSKDLRNLMKPIVMIFGYSAGVESLKRKLKDTIKIDVIETYMKLMDGKEEITQEKLSKCSPKEQAVYNFFTNYLQKRVYTRDEKGILTSNHDSLQKILKENDPSEIFIAVKDVDDDGVSITKPMSLDQVFSTLFKDSIGQSAVDGINSKFNPYSEELNPLFTDISQVGYAMFKDRIGRELAALKEKYGEHIPKKIYDECIRNNEYLLARIRTISMSNDTYNSAPDYTTIEAYEEYLNGNRTGSLITDYLKRRTSDAEVSVSTRTPYNITKSKPYPSNFNFTSEIKDFDNPGLLINVEAIHTQDGQVIMQLAGERPNNLVIHDATVVNALNYGNANIYNTRMYETTIDRNSFLKNVLEFGLYLCDKLDTIESVDLKPDTDLVKVFTKKGTRDINYKDLKKQIADVKTIIAHNRNVLKYMGVMSQNMDGFGTAYSKPFSENKGDLWFSPKHNIETYGQIIPPPDTNNSLNSDPYYNIGKAVQKSVITMDGDINLHSETGRTNIVKELANLYYSETGEKIDSSRQVELQEILSGISNIDLKGISRLIVKTNTSIATGELTGNVNIDTGEMTLVIGVSKTLTRYSKNTPLDIFAHETVHAALGYAIQLAHYYGVQDQVSQLTTIYREVASKADYTWFLEGDPKAATTEEIQYAKSMYRYVFGNRNSSRGLQEFVAVALTNKALSDKLKTLYFKEIYNPTDNSYFFKIKNLFKKIWSVILGKTKFSEEFPALTKRFDIGEKEKIDVYSAMFRLAKEIAAARNKASTAFGRTELAAKTPVWNAWNAIRVRGNKVISPIFNYLGDALPTKIANKFVHRIAQHGVTKLNAIPTLMVMPFSKDIREAAAEFFRDATKFSQQNAFLMLIRDFTRRDTFTHDLERLKLQLQTVQQHSQRYVNVTNYTITKEFLEDTNKKMLSAEDTEAMTDVLLKCDTECLLNSSITVDEIANIIENPDIAKSYKEKFVKEVTDILKKSNSNITEEEINKALSKLFIRAYSIATGNTFSNKYNDTRVTDTIKYNNKSVQSLITLYALEIMRSINPESFKTLSILNKENNNKGLKYFLNTHRKFVKSTHLPKGFVKTITPDGINFIAGKIENAQELAKQGYTLVEKVPGYDKYGIYVRDYNISDHRLGAGFITPFTVDDEISIFNKTGEYAKLKSNNPNLKIETLLEKYDYLNMDLDKAIKTLDTLANRTKAIYLDEVFTDNLEDSLNEVTQATYDIKYKFNYATKKNTLLAITDGIDILSKMMGIALLSGTTDSTTNLSNAELSNTQLYNFLEQDMINNMDPVTHKIRDSVAAKYGLKGVTYIKVEKNSSYEFMKKAWDIIPQDIKKKLNDRKEPLYIRADWLHEVFGVPTASLTHNQIIQSNNFLRKTVAMAEYIAKALTTLLKVAIVVKRPDIVVGNIVSNILLTIMRGGHPIETLKTTYRNFKYTRKYVLDVKEQQELEFKRDIGVLTDAEKARLKLVTLAIENNPVHEIAKLGFLQSIVEDIKSFTLTESNPLYRKVNSVSGRIPGKLLDAGKQLYLAKGTLYFDTMFKIVQYSDFVARVTEYQRQMKMLQDKTPMYLTNPFGKVIYQKKKGKEIPMINPEFERQKIAILNDITDSFVNYDRPQSGIEQYFNDHGLLWFIKFAKRIQHVIGTSIYKNPMGVLSIMLGEQAFGVNASDITDSWYPFKDWSMIFKNPMSLVHDAITPVYMHN